jgi:hypothetical protein
MKSKSENAKSDKLEARPRARRFVIEKLEERIVPKKGGKGTHNCPSYNTCFCSSY